METNIKDIIKIYYFIGITGHLIPLLIGGIFTIIYGILFNQECSGINNLSFSVTNIVIGILYLSSLLVHLFMYYYYMCLEIKRMMKYPSSDESIPSFIIVQWIGFIGFFNLINAVIVICIGSIIECETKHINIWFIVNGIVLGLYTISMSIIVPWFTDKYFGSESSKRKLALLITIMLSLIIFYNIFLLIWNIGMIIV